MQLKKRVKHLYYRGDYIASKKIFGNTAGAKNNLLDIFKKSKSDRMIHPRMDELIENQYLFLGQIFSHEFMSKIKTKFHSEIENDDTSFVTSEIDGNVYQRFLREPEKKIPQLGELITDEISSIIKGYYGSNFEVRRLDLWRNYHVPKEIVEAKETSSNYWHCDARSTKYIKLFILINGVTDEDGPMHIMSQKRTKELMKGGFGTREDYNIPLDKLEDPKYVVKCTGKSGTAYLANIQRIFHRAGIPSEGHHRDVIQVILAPAKDPLLSNWFDNFSQDETYSS